MYIRKCDFQTFLVMEIFGRKYWCFQKTCHFKTFVQCFSQSTDKITMTLGCTDALVSPQDCRCLVCLCLLPYEKVISWVSTVSDKNEFLGVNFIKFTGVNCSLLL